MNISNKNTALVFGARVEQGKAVLKGLVQNKQKYEKIYGVSRTIDDKLVTSLPNEVSLLEGDIASVKSVKSILQTTRATHIFVVTTTEFPTDDEYANTSFHTAMEDEYQCIVSLMKTIMEVSKQDNIHRHVVLSVLDDVQSLCTEIQPLDDGSIVPHYSGKGRAGDVVQQMLDDESNMITFTRITPAFFHSNFLSFFCPLPNNNERGASSNNNTQWTISASFGQDSKIDMMSVSDLGYIVPYIFEHPDTYANQNLRLSAESLRMDEVAATFSDLFGKDVIYNPLLYEELAELPFSSAPAMAQMCQYLSTSSSAPKQDIQQTTSILQAAANRNPQTFSDWLLVHSDHAAFEKVGLVLDAPEILKVCVFGGNSLEGRSVIRGLLQDTRKQYHIRATTRHPESGASKALLEQDERVEVVYCDLDQYDTCVEALDGMEGAFLVTDYLEGMKSRSPEMEERHARNVIDACEESTTCRHVVFSTMETAQALNSELKQGLHVDEGGVFDARARAAAYARTKNLSITFVLMPLYSEKLLEVLKPERRVDDEDDKKERVVMAVPMQDDTKVMCMSVDDLGPAVANIFDSYQVYAGHEIALVTDFVTVKEVADILTEAMQVDEDGETQIEQEQIETKEWLEARETYMKDLGQIFQSMAHTEAVQRRQSIAKTMELVPTAKPLRQWIEENKDNPEFREKLGLR